MKKIMLFLVLVSISFAQDYYPLHEGDIWEYIFLNNKSEKVRVVEYDSFSEQYTIETIQRMYNAAPIYSYEIVEKRDNYVISLSRKGGLLNFGWQHKALTILEYPLKVGQSWTRKSSENEKDIFEVVEIKDIKLDKWLFKNCVVVKQLKIYKGNIEQGGSTLSYYAPSVGLVYKTNLDGSFELRRIKDFVVKGASKNDFIASNKTTTVPNSKPLSEVPYHNEGDEKTKTVNHR